MGESAKIAVSEVIAALQRRPETFTCTKFTLTDKVTRIQYWIANGPSFVGIHHPYTMKFGWWHGRRFFKALRQWQVLEIKRREEEACKITIDN